MRLSALLLLMLFTLQLTGPMVCLTRCTEPAETASCCKQDNSSSCEINQVKKREVPNTPPSLPESCCTPCCAMPMFCGFVEEVRDIDFSLAPVSLKATFPSNNGMPLSGYLSDCWQPPELNG